MNKEIIQCIAVCITLSFITVAVTNGQPFIALDKSNIDWETLVGVLGASIAAWATITQTRISAEKTIEATKKQILFAHSATMKNKIKSLLLIAAHHKGMLNKYSNEIRNYTDTSQIATISFMLKKFIADAESFEITTVTELGLLGTWRKYLARLDEIKKFIATYEGKFEKAEPWQLKGLREDIINAALWSREIKKELKPLLIEHHLNVHRFLNSKNSY